MGKTYLITIAVGLTVGVCLITGVQLENRKTSVDALERALTMRLDAACAGPDGCPEALSDLQVDLSTVDGATPAMLEQFSYRRRDPGAPSGAPYTLERRAPRG